MRLGSDATGREGKTTHTAGHLSVVLHSWAMPKFEVDIPHALAFEDVRARLGKASSKLEKDYGANCHWDGERCLVVSRKGLNARVAVEETRLHVDVESGFLLAPMAGSIRNGITRQLTELLGSSIASAARRARLSSRIVVSARPPSTSSVSAAGGVGSAASSISPSPRARSVSSPTASVRKMARAAFSISVHRSGGPASASARNAALRAGARVTPSGAPRELPQQRHQLARARRLPGAGGRRQEKRCPLGLRDPQQTIQRRT